MKDIFKNWFNFNSRLKRKEFILTLLFFALLMELTSDWISGFAELVQICVWTFLVMLPLSTRRCNDMGVSRWWCWWYFVTVPFLGGLLLAGVAPQVLRMSMGFIELVWPLFLLAFFCIKSKKTD